jgi:hypothetical protein
MLQIMIKNEKNYLDIYVNNFIKTYMIQRHLQICQKQLISYYQREQNLIFFEIF